MAPATRALEASLPKHEMETDVSPKERAAIAAMKSKLRAYVAATMACDAMPLDKALKSGAPKIDFAVKHIAPDLVAVTATLGIQCGQDTMLSLFRQGREVLHAQSAPYKTIVGAWDMFDYAVAPPNKTGQWFAVTKTVAPWCSSTWSEVRYAAWRPDRAAPIFSAEDPIWWGGDDLGRMTVGAGDFTLRFHAQSIDDGRHNREWVRHFTVSGDKVVRTAPFANSARDFVEEWIQSDWKIAAPWTASTLGADVRAVHAKFHDKPYGEFGKVARCGNDMTEFQVTPSGADGSLFFQVAGSRDFKLVGLSNTPRC